MKTEEIIKILQGKGYKIKKPETKKSKTIKVAGKEWTVPKEYKDPYNEIKIPKGFRLPTIQEMFDLDKSELKQLFPDFEESWVAVPCQQTKLDVENETSRWFYLVRNSDANSYVGYLASSDDYGWVVFIKENQK